MKDVEVCGRKLELCDRRLRFLLFFEGFPGNFSLFIHKTSTERSAFRRLARRSLTEACVLDWSGRRMDPDVRRRLRGSCQTTGGNSIRRVVTALRSRPLQRKYKDCVGTWRRSPTLVLCAADWDVTPGSTNTAGKSEVWFKTHHRPQTCSEK